MASLKWVWTQEMDAELREVYRFAPGKARLSVRVQAMADKRRMPKHVLLHRAQRLGIARTVRRPWLDRETAYLDQHAGEMSAKAIAKALGRTQVSVVSKLAHNCYRDTERTFLHGNVRDIFGVTWERVAQWRKSGWLVPSRGDWYTGADLMRFMLLRPEAFDPRTVDVELMRRVLQEAGRRVYAERSKLKEAA